MYTLQGLHISKVTLPPCPGQFTKLASDEARDRKKSAKRELQEKARQELAKVQDTLLTPISVYFRLHFPLATVYIFRWPTCCQ